MVEVSIIIPVYNCEKFIHDAIESALDQTAKNCEVVVIDDGSTDNTTNILRSYGDRITCKIQERQGQAAAINKGVKVSAGEYIAYLDSDDMCLPERLEEQLRYLHNHPDVGLVYSDSYQIDENARITSILKSRPMEQFSLLQSNYIARSSVMHRGNCLRHVGLFDVVITGSDDWDMWIRMSEQYRLGYIEKPLVKHRIHKNNISLTRPKKLGYGRWTRMIIIQKCSRRQNKHLGLKVMLLRARIVWVLGKIPVLGERIPRLWSGLEKVFIWIERTFIKNALLNI